MHLPTIKPNRAAHQLTKKMQTKLFLHIFTRGFMSSQQLHYRIVGGWRAVYLPLSCDSLVLFSLAGLYSEMELTCTVQI